MTKQMKRRKPADRCPLRVRETHNNNNISLKSKSGHDEKQFEECRDDPLLKAYKS